MKTLRGLFRTVRSTVRSLLTKKLKTRSIVDARIGLMAVQQNISRLEQQQKWTFERLERELATGHPNDREEATKLACHLDRTEPLEQLKEIERYYEKEVERWEKKMNRERTCCRFW